MVWTSTLKAPLDVKFLRFFEPEVDPLLIPTFDWAIF